MGRTWDDERRAGGERRVATAVLEQEDRRTGRERRELTGMTSRDATSTATSMLRDESGAGSAVGTAAGANVRSGSGIGGGSPATHLADGRTLGGGFGADEATFAPRGSVYVGRDARAGAGAEEHDAIPSLAAIAGHPIHPMLVPIPIGALALTVATDVAGLLAPDRFWSRAARLLTTVGVVSGLTAGVVGAVDVAGRPRIRDHREAWLHAGGNVAALGLSAASLAFRRDQARPVPMAVALSATAGAILLVTGWLGGELSYRHRVGVTADRGGHR